MQKRVKYWENVLNYAKSVKLRKLEKNAEQEEQEPEQDFKDVEARAAIARA